MTNLTHARTHIRLCGALVSTRAYVSRSSLEILTIVVERKSQGAVPASQQKDPLAHGPFVHSCFPLLERRAQKEHCPVNFIFCLQLLSHRLLSDPTCCSKMNSKTKSTMISALEASNNTKRSGCFALSSAQLPWLPGSKVFRPLAISLPVSSCCRLSTSENYAISQHYPTFTLLQRSASAPRDTRKRGQKNAKLMHIYPFVGNSVSHRSLIKPSLVCREKEWSFSTSCVLHASDKDQAQS
jgi:hypothetical protein